MKIKNVTLSIIRGSDRWTMRGRKITEHNIRTAYAGALARADKSKTLMARIAVIDSPGFPLLGSAKILAQEILRFVRHKNRSITKIAVCVAAQRNFSLIKKTMEGYIHHVQNDLGLGPYVTVDIIIELKEGIVVIERSNPPLGWALPGGFVDPFESLETAAIRETKEETNLKLVNLRQLGTYSDPKRDPRFHTIGSVYIGKGIGKPKAGDDAQNLKVIKYADLLKFNFAFDHGKMIRDYLAAKQGSRNFLK